MKKKCLRKRLLSLGLVAMMLCSTNTMYPISVDAKNQDPPPNVEISTVTKSPWEEWTNKDVIISATVNYGHGEQADYSVRYSTVATDYAEDLPGTPAENTKIATLVSDKTYSFTHLLPESSGETTYYLWVYDGATDEADKEKSEVKEITVKIDKEHPIVENINSTSEGVTTNAPVTISGTVSDLGGAGLAKVRYSYAFSDFEQDTLDSTNNMEASLEGENYSFVLDTEVGEDTLEHTYYVWAYDASGNKSAEAQEMDVDIDKTAPKITSVVKSPDAVWSNQPVTITVDALQENPEKNIYNVSSIKYNKVNDIDSATIVTTNDNGIFTFTTPNEQFQGTYYIWAINENRTPSKPPSQIAINIETTPPAITSFEYKTKNGNPLSRVLNFISGGFFCNKAIEVIVTAADEVGGSGLKEIIFYEDGEEKESKAVDANGQATFPIETLPFKKAISAKASDIAGNVSERTTPKDINEEDGDIVILEDTKPILEVTPSEVFYTDSKKIGWYKGDAQFDVQISDQADGDSGIKSVIITLNGKTLTKDSNDKEIKANYENTDTKSDTYVIGTKQGKIKEDNTFTLEIKVIDNCNNIEEYTTTVYQDTTKPSIVKAGFSPVGNQESKGQIVKVAKYGYFFKDTTQVTLTAKDNKDGSGVKSITYYTVDYSEKKSGVKSEILTKSVNENNQISFLIKADFKGKIYAKATDQVEYSCEFVTPDASIVESEAKHKATSNITIKTPSTSKKDNSGLDLYTQDVSVDLIIGDYYSGLSKVEWSVESPYDQQNQQSGIITIDNDGVLKGNIEKEDKTKTDKNLVTEVQKNIRITNNSNNIKVKVKLTDRVGHTSEKEMNFSIDKTSPTIQISYDNNDFDNEFVKETKYFKENRTATIVVTERNFESQNAKVTISNLDGNTPTVSNWVESKNTEDENKTTHTATITYVQDGDYNFGMTFQDLAGNQAAQVEPESFTIDKTVPTIQVSYNNNQADTTNYYKEARTATITVNEHNFETTRIKPTLSAAEGTKAPSMSNWSTSGDIHTATVTFQEDSLYTFDMEYTDKAGNPAQKLPQETFYVDKTAPTLTVTGIKNNSANSGKDDNKNETNVGFVMESTDENFEGTTPHLTMVTLEGTKNCDDLLGTPQNIQSGQRYSVQNLKADGIYILSATSTDKAGNETKAARVTSANGTVIETEQIIFSINRNGSVYTLDAKTQEINGSYSKEETDITIQETNVNELNEMKLTLFSDGGTKVLEEGKDFQLNKTTGNGQWNQYSYTIFKENFKEDGFYNLALYSVDAAENESENTMDTKNVEVHFAIDKTAPNLILTDLKDKEAYKVPSKQITMVINDNIKLENVSVYHTTYKGSPKDANYAEPSATWTAEEIQQLQKENVDFTYTIDGTSTEKHKVKIVARDAAGSESIIDVADFYVGENMWINYKTNSTKVVATAVGVVILLGGAMTAILLRRRKRNLA